MDQVHEETDEKLKEIEEKVKSVYDTAQKEAKEKLDTYLKQFTDEDKEKQADVQAGDMTWTQYKKWRQDKILTGNRYRAMSEQLTSDYVNADKIAMSIVNGFTPEVYAMNYNYGTYEAESGSMVDTSFTLYDRQTVERLIRDDPDLLPKANVDIPKDKRWNRQKLNSAITQGVLQGDSIPDISKRLQSVTDMDRRAAIRNARTMTTSAENGGRQDSYTRAESMGIKMKKQWMATLDSTTRDSHAIADGQVVGTKDTFHLMHGELEYPGDPVGPPSEVYNCFVGSTIAYANNEIFRSYKHWYDGDLIEIKTAGGVSFSVTPNHPILSIDGWVHANALHDGDNILVADFSGDSVSGYPDINHIPARMDAFHKFFNKFGSKRTCSLGVNFHGDVPTSDVEIVTKKWFLLNNRNPGRSKSIDKFLLKFANKSCMSKSPFVKHLWSIAFSTLGNVRSMSKMLSFIFGSMCHTVVHSGRTIPDLDVVISQNSIDNLSAEAILSGKGLDGLTGKVSTDKIVSVKIYSFHGYVYNLQTKDNYYCVNSIISNGKYAIAHNCRCTMVAVVDGVDPSIRPDAVSRNSKLGGMTYDEWKEEHQQRADAQTARAQKSEQTAKDSKLVKPVSKSFSIPDKVRFSVTPLTASDDWFEYENANAMREYIKTGTMPKTDINGSEIAEETRERLAAEAEIMQSIGSTTKTNYKTLYRGIVLDEDEARAISPGEAYVFDTLSATATDKNIASIYTNVENSAIENGIPVIFEIQKSDGIFGFDRDGIEVVLPKGSEFRITRNWMDENGKVHISLYAKKGKNVGG